ncbi:MAG: mercuric ion transporter MerT [Nitrospinae bacterium]|nr:mercuric ion transporter MerT [Nitrospinota bacterium]
MPVNKSKSAPLAVGGISAILASACCLGPLLLVALGFGGAWAGNLHVLEPFRPYLLGVALVSMFFAWRGVYRPKIECNGGEICSLPQTNKIYRGVFWVVAVLVLAALTFPYIAPLFY